MATQAENADKAFQVEQRGIELTPATERHGHPRELFMVWFAANLVILGVVIGGVLMSLGMTIPEALLADVLGCASFFALGAAAVPGARVGTATLVLSRAAFGPKGNVIPSTLSWITLVGWETVSLIVSTYALAELFNIAFGASATSPVVLVVSLIVAAILTFGVTLLGHQTIVWVQTWATWVFGIVTAIVVIFLISHFKAPTAAPSPATGKAFTTFLLAMSIMFASTIFAWLNYAADYTRYLPEDASAKSITWWNGLGAFIPGTILIGTGVLIGGLVNIASAANPITALMAIVPGWMVVPFLITAVVGMLTGNYLNSYSSGLSMQAMGVRLPRTRTVWIDATISILASLYAILVFNFSGAFTGFLILEVEWIASWGAIYIVDSWFRIRHDGYDKEALFQWGSGAYWYSNGINWATIGCWLLGSLGAIAFTNSTLFASPLTKMWLGGADLSVFMGFGISALTYWLVLRSSYKKSQAQAPAQAQPAGK